MNLRTPQQIQTVLILNSEVNPKQSQQIPFTKTLKISSCKLLEYRIVGFGVGPPKHDILNLSLRTVISLRRAWKQGCHSIVDVPGCSKAQNIPLQEHRSIKTSALAHNVFPCSTGMESLRPNGFAFVRKVLPMLLSRMRFAGCRLRSNMYE